MTRRGSIRLENGMITYSTSGEVGERALSSNGSHTGQEKRDVLELHDENERNG